MRCNDLKNKLKHYTLMTPTKALFNNLVAQSRSLFKGLYFLYGENKCYFYFRHPTVALYKLRVNRQLTRNTTDEEINMRAEVFTTDKFSHWHPPGAASQTERPEANSSCSLDHTHKLPSLVKDPTPPINFKHQQEGDKGQEGARISSPRHTLRYRKLRLPFPPPLRSCPGWQ